MARASLGAELGRDSGGDPLMHLSCLRRGCPMPYRNSSGESPRRRPRASAAGPTGSPGRLRVTCREAALD
eukprot:6951554-Pyramimonas_sp.AAC.1